MNFAFHTKFWMLIVAIFLILVVSVWPPVLLAALIVVFIVWSAIELVIIFSSIFEEDVEDWWKGVLK